MLGAGIHPIDSMIVDCCVESVHEKIVICALNGELTVKRLQNCNGNLVLAAENPAYADIPIHEEIDMIIWGVVTSVIHSV